MQQCLKAYFEYQRSISINFTFHSIELYPSSCRANYTTYILHVTSFLVYQRSIFSYNDARITIVSMHQENNQRDGKKKNIRVVHKKIQRGCALESQAQADTAVPEMPGIFITQNSPLPPLVVPLLSRAYFTNSSHGIPKPLIASESVFPFFMWTTYLRLLPQLVLVYLEVGF